MTAPIEPIVSSSQIDVHTATIDALVAICSSASYKTLGEAPNGSDRRIVKISEQAVIKFDIGVTESEANNQRGAYLLLDLSIVRIPRVYRFFIKRQYDYIINQCLVHKVARTLAYLAEISCRVIGLLRSGISRGLFWPDNKDPSFKNILDIERYFNSRLVKGSL